MDLSRRKFIGIVSKTALGAMAGAGSTVNAGAFLQDSAKTPDALSPFPLWMPATHVIPRSYRVLHSVFGDGDSSDKLPVGLCVSLARPHDMLRLDIEFLDARIERKHGKWRLFSTTGNQIIMVVHFPPQHVAEDPVAGVLVEPTEDKLPRLAMLSKPSRLAFQINIPDEGLEYSLDKLLEWDRLAQNIATAKPDSRQTQIEYPWGLGITPVGNTRWMHGLAQHDLLNQMDPKVSSSSPPVALWHTNLASNQKNGTAQLRALTSNPDQPPFPLSFPNHVTRTQIIERTRDLPVTADRMFMSAMGISAKVNGKWERKPGNPLLGWKHETELGRDNFASISYRGYAGCFGHQCTYTRILRREFVDVRTARGVRKVALLRHYIYCELEEDNLAYEDVSLQQDQKGHRMPFPSVTLSPKRTPYLETVIDVVPNSPANNESPLAFWMFPLGSKDPFAFNVAAKDWEGNTCQFKLPLLWISAGCAESDDPDVQNRKHFASVVKEYCNRKDWRTAEIKRQKVAYVPRAENGTNSPSRDTAVETVAMTFMMEQSPGFPAQDCWPDTGDADFQLPKNWDEQRKLRFYPGLQHASVVLDGVGQFAPQSEIKAVPIEYHPRYVKSGFRKSENKAELWAQVSNAEGVQMAFGGDRSGGLSTPNLKIVRLSRIFGPVGPPSTPPDANPLVVAKQGAPSDSFELGKFDPKAFFSQLNTAARLLGGIDLTEVVAPVEDAINDLTRVPRLIAEKIQAFKQEIEPLINAVRQLVEFIEKPEVILQTITKKITDQVTPFLEGYLNVARNRIAAEILTVLEEASDLAIWIDATGNKIASDLNLSQNDAALLRAVIKEIITTPEYNLVSFQQRVTDIATQRLRCLGEATLNQLRPKIETQVMDKFKGIKRSLAQKREDLLVAIRRVCEKYSGIVDSKRKDLQTQLDSIRQSFPIDEFDRIIKEWANFVDGIMNRIALLPIAEIKQSAESLIAIANGKFEPITILTDLPRELDRFLTALKQLSSAPAPIPALAIGFVPKSTLGNRFRNGLIALGTQVETEVRRLHGMVEDVTYNVGRKVDAAQKMEVDAQIKETLTSIANLTGTGSTNLNQFVQDVRDAVDWTDALKNSKTFFEEQLGSLNSDSPLALKNQVLKQINGFLDAGNGVLQSLDDVAGEFEQTIKLAQEKVQEFLDAAHKVSEVLPKELSLDYSWEPRLQNAPKDKPFFEARTKSTSRNARFVLNAKVRKSLLPEELTKPPTISVDGKLTDCTIHLLPSTRFLSIEFEHVSFASINGSKPNVEVAIANVEFGEALEFVKKLSAILNRKSGPYLDISPKGVLVGYRFALPSISSGAFNLLQLAITTSVSLPFDGDRVKVRFSLCERHLPFIMNVGVLGGGGFFAIVVGPDGVDLLEGSMEFGAIVALDIGVASGKAYVTAGIYFSVSKDSACLTGFLRAGGALNVLGIITISVEFYLGFGYEKRDGRSYAVGEAIVKVEIHIFFFSVEVELHYRKELEGGGSPSTAQQFGSTYEPDSSLQQSFAAFQLLTGAGRGESDSGYAYFTNEEWRRYRKKFYSKWNRSCSTLKETQCH